MEWASASVSTATYNQNSSPALPYDDPQHSLAPANHHRSNSNQQQSQRIIIAHPTTNNISSPLPVRTPARLQRMSLSARAAGPSQKEHLTTVFRYISDGKCVLRILR
jgi:hypothetical protein